MKIFRSLCIMGLFLALPVPAQSYSWHKAEHSLALLNGTNMVWQIVADPAQGKPYFHPLATPEGTLLTDLRPKDHPWHRGLWWSWKFINDLNYWEEDDQTHRSEAATELTDYQLRPHQDGSAELKFLINYHPWNATAILTEQRAVEISTPTNGSYELKWTSAFTAVTNVTLSRTPPPGEPGGVSWGGYAGLSLRLNQATRSWTFSNSEGASGIDALHGKQARWMKFSSGPNRPAVAIFDEPRNVRHPVPWYVNQGMPFFSPSPLFAKNLTLVAGEKLILHYRIVITDHDSAATQPTKIGTP